MKKVIILLTITLTVFSCKVKEKPEFLRLENIKVLESTSDNVTLAADAFFLNPNDIGGELKSDGIKVFVNDNEMATVSSESFKVPAKKEFSIPLKAKIPADRIFSGKNIGGLIGGLLSKKLKVQYKGNIKYKTLGFTYTYDIDKTEDVKIKL
ncbi:MAG: LEA type 2 family protein [Flavobacteriaceae bacterium]|nr:LEA type 2 family protein [Flavobacteriaceae bacterium]